MTLPAIQVGTVGGGTGIATQKECLELLGVAAVGRALDGLEDAYDKTPNGGGKSMGQFAEDCAGKYAFTREELWGTGNRETFLNAFFSRQSILLYALKTHRRNRERFAIECAFLGKEKTLVRLKSSRDVEAFLASHSAPAG